MDVLPVGRLDDRVHGKVRLAVLTLLCRHGAMTFLALKASIQTTDGNLAIHLRKLETAGFIELTRDFEGRQRRTNAVLTDEGRSAYRAYATELLAWLKP